VAGFQFQLLFATTTTTTTRITKTTQRRTSAGLEKQKQKQKTQKQKQKRKRPPQKHKKHNFFTHRVPVRVPRAGRHAKVKKDKLIERHFLVRLTKTQKQSATLLLVLLTRTELTPISIWYALLALFYRDIFYLASYLASWRVVVHVVCTRVPPTGVFFFLTRARILFHCCRVSSSSFARSTRRERTNAPIIANGEVFFLRTERFCFRRITSLVSFCISH
jgi:hypothetical protein